MTPTSQWPFDYLEVLQAAGEGICWVDTVGRLAGINSAGAHLLGYAPDDFVGRDHRDLLRQAKHGQPDSTEPGNSNGCSICAVLSGTSRRCSSQEAFYRADGTHLSVECITTPLEAEGALSGVVVCFREITAGIRQQQLTVRLNRVLRFTTEVNRTLARARDRQQMLDAVCEAAVGSGGFHIASVGELGAESEPLRWAGLHVSGAQAPTAADTLAGAFYTAMRTFKAGPEPLRYLVWNDVEQAADTAPWRARAGLCGVRACAMFPLRTGRRIWGALALCSAEPDYFQEESLRLLADAAEDLALAALTIEQESHRQQAEEALEKLSRQNELLLRAAGDGIFGLDTEGNVAFVNPAAARMLGYESAELVGQDQHALVHHSRADGSRYPVEECPIHGAVADGSVHHGTGEVFWRKDGTQFPIEFTCTPTVEDGKVIGAVVTFRDVSERHRAEAALRESEDLYRTLAEAARDMIFIVDAQGVVRYVNSFAARQFGKRPEELVGQRQSSLFPPDAAEVHVRNLHKVLKSGEPLYAEEETPFPEIGNVWLGTWLVPIRDQQGQATAVMGVSRDITDRKRAEEQLLHDAFHDALTDLPNRALFLDRLERAAQRAKRHGKLSYAVLFLDVDGFKVVNDSLGHSAGDQLLVAIAERLLGCLRDADTVARLGGDEFAVLLEDIDEAADATRVSERIHAALARSFVLEGQEVFVSASIGIAMASPDTATSEELLRDADIAMYRAKALGKARYQVFDPAMHARAMTRLHLETDLRRAVVRDELLLHYQPIVDLKTGRVASFEALVRWQHPTRGLIPPLDFIPVAEEIGLIIPIGEWVLREACRQVSEWHERFPQQRRLAISVNLSGKQFDQHDFSERVRQILEEARLKPNRLSLELTESVIMENADASTILLRQLTELQVHLAIDDFGTGYSSLSYLHRFPIDTLKIDRSFIARMGLEENRPELVHTILALADSLHIKVVAEGAETAQQVEQLRSMGCDYAQGYYFSPPMDGNAATRLLAEGMHW